MENELEPYVEKKDPLREFRPLEFGQVRLSRVARMANAGTIEDTGRGASMMPHA
jgi:hypothetical protein